jgi:hypothetical protein
MNVTSAHTAIERDADPLHGNRVSTPLHQDRHGTAVPLDHGHPQSTLATSRSRTTGGGLKTGFPTLAPQARQGGWCSYVSPGLGLYDHSQRDRPRTASRRCVETRFPSSPRPPVVWSGRAAANEPGRAAAPMIKCGGVEAWIAATPRGLASIAGGQPIAGKQLHLVERRVSRHVHSRDGCAPMLCRVRAALYGLGQGSQLICVS